MPVDEVDVLLLGVDPLDEGQGNVRLDVPLQGLLVLGLDVGSYKGVPLGGQEQVLVELLLRS